MLFLVPLINVLHLVRFITICIILLVCFCAGACAEHSAIVMENATSSHNSGAAANVSSDVQNSDLNGFVKT